ncbi:MAG: hypothetical protein K0R00_883 [Herbinix sp.]|jgi:hypothetical protein|nr:hypothetical protein [Herbinix sp.]
MATDNKNIDEKKKKSCFIITPIGDDNDPIRRHIDGLIDECIIPVLREKYLISVAHRMASPGSITNQIIAEIYNADLVIANLTNLNANVMYELAFRHSVKRPVIIIMEKDTGNLPFDTITERTIFYTNDFKGAIELKERIIKAVEFIEDSDIDVDNPIYTALEKIMVRENIIKNIAIKEGEDASALQYIIDTLQSLENKVTVFQKNTTPVTNSPSIETLYIHNVKEDLDKFKEKVHQVIMNFTKKNHIAFLFTVSLLESSRNSVIITAVGINKDEYEELFFELNKHFMYEISEMPF